MEFLEIPEDSKEIESFFCMLGKAIYVCSMFEIILKEYYKEILIEEKIIYGNIIKTYQKEIIDRIQGILFDESKTPKEKGKHIYNEIRKITEREVINNVIPKEKAVLKYPRRIVERLEMFYNKIAIKMKNDGFTDENPDIFKDSVREIYGKSVKSRNFIVHELPRKVYSERNINEIKSILLERLSEVIKSMIIIDIYMKYKLEKVKDEKISMGDIMKWVRLCENIMR